MIRQLMLGCVLLFALLTAPAASLTPAAHAAPVALHVASPAAAHAAFFDKTRVVIHLAIAYGVFHHWVWKPFKAGDLSIHHPIKLVKAGLALLFAVHELKVAYGITSHSSSPTLQHLNGIIVGLSDKFTSVGNLFHKDPASLTDAQVASSINGLNSGVDSSNKILNAPDAPLHLLGNFG